LQAKSDKRVWGTRNPQEGKGDKGLIKGANSRGLKPRNKIILFISHKIYDIIYPKFLSMGNKLPSGVKDIS
jgi:hypothetical protein